MVLRTQLRIMMKDKQMKSLNKYIISVVFVGMLPALSYAQQYTAVETAKTGVESLLAISTKQEGASHCLIGDDEYPYRKRRGSCTVVVKLDSHSGLSFCAE